MGRSDVVGGILDLKKKMRDPCLVESRALGTWGNGSQHVKCKLLRYA